MQSIVPIIIWVVIIGLFLFFWFGGRKNKKKYEGQSMEITRGWYETSQSMYSQDEEKKAYYFEYDKNYLTQGHLMVDRNHQTIYEAKILYGDPANGYETDLINHLINFKHHHKISAVVTTGVSADRAGIATSSYFKFDGENVWQYLEELGYDYHFKRSGLAYQFNVEKDGAVVGTIYSSNGGKNYFKSEGPITAKAGGKGLYIVECADKDIDAMFLMTMAFTRTEFSMENMK